MDQEKWGIADELWARVEPLLPERKRIKGQYYRRQEGGGRKALPERQIFGAIVHVLKHGIPWRSLPAEYGSPSSIHGYFRRWERDGLFSRIWRKGLAEHADMGGIAWEWLPEGDASRSRNRLAPRRVWRPCAVRRRRDKLPGFSSDGEFPSSL